MTDYIPHHEPFEYYASTANPMHLPPTSVAMVGHSDQANHQYDIADFWAAADAGNLPAVSYLKAPAYQDGHAGYSDPLDEQTWLRPPSTTWSRCRPGRSTAIVVTWDDSDGWYDHVLGPVLSQSQISLDALTGTGACGSQPERSAHQLDRRRRSRAGAASGRGCPSWSISPYAKSELRRQHRSSTRARW